jgi:hypothetical protein
MPTYVQLTCVICEALFETDYPNETLVKIDKTNYNIIEEYLQK